MQTCRNPIFSRDENQRQVSPPLPNQIIHKIVSLVLLSCGCLWVGPSSGWYADCFVGWSSRNGSRLSGVPLPLLCDLVHGMCGECLAGFPSICFGTVHVESTHEPPSELACQVSVSLRRSSGAGSLVSHHPRCFLLRAHEVQKLSHTMAGPLFCSLFHSFGVKSQDRPHKSGSALLHEKPGGHKQPLMALKHLIFRKLHAFSNTRLCFTSASLLVQDIGRTLGIRADPITIPHESEPCSFHHPHECAFPKSWVTSWSAMWCPSHMVCGRVANAEANWGNRLKKDICLSATLWPLKS